MKISSIRHLEEISEKIKNKLKVGDVVFLYGEIGVGKTTFARLLINNYENEKNLKASEVLSPTFNIVYEYEVGQIKIQHYDLFRLSNYKDISQLGIFESSNKHIKIIEWPELIKPKPLNRIDIMFKYSKLVNSRQIKISGFGKWNRFKFNEI